MANNSLEKYSNFWKYPGKDRYVLLVFYDNEGIKDFTIFDIKAKGPVIIDCESDDLHHEIVNKMRNHGVPEINETDFWEIYDSSGHYPSQ